MLFSGLAVRGSSLQARIDKLAVKVSKSSKRYAIFWIPIVQARLSISIWHGFSSPSLVYLLTASGDTVGLQCWRGHSPRDSTKKSFPLHSELWPAGGIWISISICTVCHCMTWGKSFWCELSRRFQSFLYQVVSRETMPKSMLEQYLACDKPPPLDKLNPYRWNILCLLAQD